MAVIAPLDPEQRFVDKKQRFTDIADRG